jgi:hypothetical protein
MIVRVDLMEQLTWKALEVTELSLFIFERKAFRQREKTVKRTEK